MLYMFQAVPVCEWHWIPVTQRRIYYRGADKSLARPGRKQRPNSNFRKPLKKKIRYLSVQPGLRRSNNLRVGRKMATFQFFFQSGRAKDLSAPLQIM
jgi:hypothetical protein